MNLADQLREQILSFVRGERSLSALRSWLESHVQEIEDADDPALDDLDGSAWNILAEWDYGHWDAARVRSEFRELLAAPADNTAVADVHQV